MTNYFICAHVIGTKNKFKIIVLKILETLNVTINLKVYILSPKPNVRFKLRFHGPIDRYSTYDDVAFKSKQQQTEIIVCTLQNYFNKYQFLGKWY